MKLFGKILIGILVIIAIPLIMALFMKNEYAVEREITINKPQQEVFNYIKYLKNQDYYSEWVMIDPAMKKEFKGADGTVGFIYGWDGNDKAGKGEQEITRLIEGKEVDTEVRFEKPMQGVAYATMKTTAISAVQTKVDWKMKGSNAYPCNFMNLFVDGMLGKDMEKSLVNLRENLAQR